MDESGSRPSRAEDPAASHPSGRAIVPPTRLSRRGLLLALGGVAVGSLPALVRGGSIEALYRAALGTKGKAPSQEELKQILADGLDGSLPLFLPTRLPAGWTPAPYEPDPATENTGEAVFRNPALRPGVFYRVGYTRGSSGYLGELITLTARVPVSQTDLIAEDRPPNTETETVVGDYLNIPIPTDGTVEVVVQGRLENESALRAIAAAVSPA